jgi:hypothetical protein
VTASIAAKPELDDQPSQDAEDKVTDDPDR